MCGPIPPLPNTPSWRGAQLKAQGHLYLYILPYYPLPEELHSEKFKLY
jgi:hypothetical protein